MVSAGAHGDGDVCALGVVDDRQHVLLAGGVDDGQGHQEVLVLRRLGILVSGIGLGLGLGLRLGG